MTPSPIPLRRGASPNPIPRPGLRTAAILVLGIAAGTGAAAAGPLDRGEVAPSDPAFAALLTDGTTVTGPLRGFGPGPGVRLAPDGKGKPRTIPFARLVKLTQVDSAPPFPPDGSLVLFPGGDRLLAVIGPARETTLETRSPLLEEVAVPLDSLQGLLLIPPTEPGALDALIDAVRAEPKGSEVLWLANGDRQKGGFLGIDPVKVQFQLDTGPVRVERAGVVAIGFDPKLANYPRPDGAFAEVTLSDGSRLGLTGLRLEKGQVSGTTRFGVAIKFALGDLARLHVQGGPVAYLSERAASAAQYVGFVGPVRPYRRDRAVDGPPLTLRKQVYDRGLGTQSRSLLAYKLEPGFGRFQATVGLDDRAGPLGSVVFRVLVDGTERFATPPLSVHDDPKAVDVDIRGAKVLILATEFGERGDVRDLADWVEARLVR